jgi:hypothetical protein
LGWGNCEPSSNPTLPLGPAPPLVAPPLVAPPLVAPPLVAPPLVVRRHFVTAMTMVAEEYLLALLCSMRSRKQSPICASYWRQTYFDGT